MSKISIVVLDVSRNVEESTFKRGVQRRAWLYLDFKQSVADLDACGLGFFVILVCMFLGSVSNHLKQCKFCHRGLCYVLRRFSSLHDVYDGLDVNENCQKATYIMQFPWRDLTSDFDVIGPISHPLLPSRRAFFTSL